MIVQNANGLRSSLLEEDCDGSRSNKVFCVLLQKNPSFLTVKYASVCPSRVDIDAFIEKCFQKERLTTEVRLLFPFHFCKRVLSIFAVAHLQEIKVLCEKAKEILAAEPNVKPVRHGFMVVMHVLVLPEKCGEVFFCET